MAKENSSPQTTGLTAPPPTPPAVPPASKNASERFTEMVMRQFGGTVGAPELSNFQKRLIQGYFIAVDRALKTAEDERNRKNEKNRDHKSMLSIPTNAGGGRGRQYAARHRWTLRYTGRHSRTPSYLQVHSPCANM